MAGLASGAAGVADVVEDEVAGFDKDAGTTGVLALIATLALPTRFVSWRETEVSSAALADVESYFDASCDLAKSLVLNV